jgi:hypothetical protein
MPARVWAPRHAHQAEGGPTGRARAGGVGIVVAGACRHHGGPSLHCRFEDNQIRTASALLGCIHRCGTFGPEQWVVYIAGHEEPRPLRRGVQTGQIQSGGVDERRATGGQRVAVGVEDFDAECLQQSRSAIGGGAAAESDDDLAGAAVQRRPDHGAEPERGCAEGVEGAIGQLVKSDRGGQFHYGTRSPHGIVGADRLPGRPGGVDRSLSPSGGDCGGDGTVTAVGNRQLGDRPFRALDADSLGHRVGDLRGGQRALELVGRHQHASSHR